MARYLPAFLFASALLGGLPAGAQTVQPTIATGANPSRITVNPVTNTIYVTNYDSNTVSAINGATGGVTTIPVGARPTWIAVNPETNKVYVSNAGASGSGPSLMVLNGATNTVSSTLAVGDVGWTAINQVTNKTYVVRYGNGDEVNIILDERYVNTAATRSYQPVAIALNPYTNILYMVHRATGDVTAIDARVDQSVVQDNINNYPPLLCPNGSGGYKPSPGPSDPDPGACINVNDPPSVVTVNPVTDMIYSASDGTTEQIAVIRGSTKTNPHTFTRLSPPGVTGAAKAIAVNPVSNKVYAVFTNHIVVVNGADNAMTVIPSSGAVAVGVNSSTNTIYVPHADGTLKVINGATNAVTATLAIPLGAVAIAVNPVTNIAYAVTASGVTPIIGAASAAATIALTTTITPLPSDTSSGGSGSITMNASASAGFGAPRRVYFQIDSTAGAWQAASGSGTGPYTAAFSGLANGSHTIRAFATDALDAPATATDVQHNPLIGMIASYTFTVGAAPSPVDASISLATSQNPSNPGQAVTFTAAVTGSAGVATGTVSFRDAGVAIGGCASVALSSGSAACTVSTLSSGGHSITAQYSGSASYNPGTSSAIAQVVKATATVGVVSSSNPSTAAQSVTFTASVTGSSGVATGTVNFVDGGTSIAGCDAVPLSGGSAACTTTALAVGSHPITAQYSGNASYGPGNSPVLNQAVKANPTVTAASSLNPSTAGQAVTFTANVSGSSGVPSGTVNFLDGATSIASCASVTLSSGSATCTTASLSSGSHAITAQYSGSTTYNGVTSAALTQVVKANPTIGLTSSLNPATTGQAVTFTANVSGSAGVPSGTVNFFDGATSIASCAAVALSSGSATCTTAALSSGSHSITAQYSGSATYNGITSAVVTQVVKANATVGLASSQNPSTAGQSVTFTANVSGSAGAATGTMNFLDGGTSIAGCAAVALSGGSATCATTGLSTGSHSITAQYSGSATYNGATSAVLTQTVKVNATVGLTSSANPSTAGQSVAFTANVSGSAGAATGTVNFLDGGTSIAGCAAVTLSGGAATCTTAGLSSGSHAITAQYSGSATYNAATSGALTQVVKANATVGLTSSLNPSTAGQSITFTANVIGSAGTATGTVNFLDGGTSIAACSAVTLSGGSATCTSNALSAGSHSITVQYVGDSIYNPGTSAPLSQVVNPGTAASMLSPAPGSTLAGATQTFTWSNAGAGAYQLLIGNSPGSYDIGAYPPGGTAATSTTVSGLPTDGRTLYVRLYSSFAGTLSFRDYAYTAANVPTAPPSPAEMTSPAPGSMLAGSTQAFTWSSTGADVYQVWVGNSVGSYDIGAYPPGGTAATSATASGLPTDGRTLYVRLYSSFAGVLYSRDYTYTAATAAGPTAAAMTSPAAGSTLAGATQTFAWSNTGADLYQVWVGNSPGSYDVGAYPPGGTAATSATAGGLPTDGRTLYVRLYSSFAGALYFRDYTYTAATATAPTAASMMAPAPGSTLAGSTQTFTWSNAGASVYQVWVGNAPGSYDIGAYPPGGTAGTTATATGLPTDGRTLYVRLYSSFAGDLYWRDYTYRARP